MKNEMQNFFSKILLYAGTVFVHNCPLLLSVNTSTVSTIPDSMLELYLSTIVSLSSVNV